MGRTKRSDANYTMEAYRKGESRQKGGEIVARDKPERNNNKLITASNNKDKS